MVNIDDVDSDEEEPVLSSKKQSPTNRQSLKESIKELSKQIRSMQGQVKVLSVKDSLDKLKVHRFGFQKKVVEMTAKQ